MGAALAYYTAFSLAPLLLIAIAIASLVFHEAARERITAEIATTVGDSVADSVRKIMASSQGTGSGVTATIIGIVVLLFGASGVFVELQDSLNTIWGVEAKPGGGVKSFIVQRFLSFGMVLGTGFLLLVSLIISTALSAIGTFLTAHLPGGVVLWQAVNLLVSFGIVTLLFALIFKVLPDVELGWKDVWVGAAITALLFTVGKYLLGLYIAHGSVASGYGAAGSLVIILFWVYYSAQILLYGAALTRVYADRYGSHVRPSENAVPVTPEAKARQGIPDLPSASENATQRSNQPVAGRH
jgi:membrane protein